MRMRRQRRLCLTLACTLLVLLSSVHRAMAGCGEQGVWLQVLGSGGPEADDQRASSGYLVWHDGKGRVLVDLGSGSLANFERAGGRLDDLDAVLISHFHADHANDLPALVKASWFTERTRPLPLYGPSGNGQMPGALEFAQTLLGPQGAFRYLAGYLDGRENYRLIINEVAATGEQQAAFRLAPDLSVVAVPVHHGPNPALAWRVNVGGASLVFSGDLSGRNGTLAGLARGADLLVAHHAVPEGAASNALVLHMPPSEIGCVAAEAGVHQLVLSHRMNRSLGHEAQTLAEIRRSYEGPVQFAEDLECFAVKANPGTAGL